MVCTGGVCPFENLIGNGSMGIVGNNVFLGMVFLGLFGAVVFILPGRLDFKLMVLTPIVILSALFIPQLIIPFAIAMAFLVFFGIMRLINK